MNYKLFIIGFINICILEKSALEKYITDEIGKHAPNNLVLGQRMENETRKTRDILLQVANNTILSSTTNLKSNIFDKMLSEEILSIKQHFYKKDSSHTPSVQITIKGNVATPTLEVNQKWPFAHLLSKTFIAENKTEEQEGEENNILFNIPNKSACDQGCDIQNNEVKDKVLGLRSLPGNREVKICGCMKTNPDSTCSQQCTGIDITRENKICSHTPNGLEMHQGCTRTTKLKSTIPSYSAYPVYVTYPYFWEISTYTFNPYYHPNSISNLKLSKTKRRHKKKKPHSYIEEIYKTEILEDYNEDIKDNPLDVYYDDKEFSRKSTKLSDKESDFKYDENTSNELYFVNKDSLVNDIVEDLKRDYSDVVIKDCYCSLSPLNNISSVFLYLSLFTCVYFLAPVF